VLAVVRRSQKNFAPPQTPFPRAQDGQNLISWRWSLPSPTDPVWWGSIHAISSCRDNRLTNTHTNPQTGPITIHYGYAAASLARSVMKSAIIVGPFGLLAACPIFTIVRYYWLLGQIKCLLACVYRCRWECCNWCEVKWLYGHGKQSCIVR